MTVASVLGIGAHRVVVKVKRMGGGFGGKESRYVLKVFSLSLSQREPVCPKTFSKRVSLLKDYFTFTFSNTAILFNARNKSLSVSFKREQNCQI